MTESTLRNLTTPEILRQVEVSDDPVIAELARRVRAEQTKNSLLRHNFERAESAHQEQEAALETYVEENWVAFTRTAGGLEALLDELLTGDARRIQKAMRELARATAGSRDAPYRRSYYLARFEAEVEPVARELAAKEWKEARRDY